MKNLILILASSVALSIALGVLPAASQDVSAHAYIALDKADLGLLDAGETADYLYHAAVDIRLHANVKTYWRMAGDSGLPPVFDFSHSQNVASVEIKWPQPSRIIEADGTIFGYQERVVFPLVITPKQAGEPVTLAVSLDFGLCDTLCLPAKAQMQRTLSKTGDADAKAEFAAALARVPIVATWHDKTKPSLIAAQPQGDALVLTFVSETTLKDVMIEAAGSWFFDAPVIVADGADHYRVTVPVAQKPKAAGFAGLALVVTAISETGATETSLTIDASGSIR